MLNGLILTENRIGGVIVRVFASIAVDQGFETPSGQTKDYEIDKWSNMSIRGLLFQ